jgi:hypothetical protein
MSKREAFSNEKEVLMQALSSEKEALSPEQSSPNRRRILNCPLEEVLDCRSF